MEEQVAQPEEQAPLPPVAFKDRVYTREEYSRLQQKCIMLRMEHIRWRKRVSALEKKAPVAVARLSKKLTMKEKHLSQAYEEIYRQKKYIKRLKERIEKMKGEILQARWPKP